jgi:dolichol-phosphate mannosyltransferase
MNAVQGFRAGISAVLPCFEEVTTLESIVEATARALGDTELAAHEVILVCSHAARDGTPELARRLSAGSARLRCVMQSPDDLGYGRAVTAGITASRLAWIWLLDADGQFDPADLPLLLASAGQSTAVFGFRARRRDGLARLAASWLYSLVSNRLVGSAAVRDPDCAFKLFPAAPLRELPLTCRTGAVNIEILLHLLRAGNDLAEVSIPHHARRTGRSRFEFHAGPLRHLPLPGEAMAMAGEIIRLAIDANRMGLV